MGTQTNNPDTTVAAGAALPAYRLVDLAGQLAVASKFTRILGVNQETVASGAPARARRLRAGTCKIQAAGAIKFGQRCYSAASGKISSSRAGVYVGRALAAAVADLDIIEVDSQAPEVGLLFSQVAASAVITNTVAETAFDQSVTLPADELQPGDEIQIDAQGICPSTNATDTLTIRLKIGTTVIVTTGAVDVANNDIFRISARLKIRTDGAGGTLVAEGVQSLGVEGTVTAKPFKLASTAVDTTATQAITASAQWSVANAGNQVRLDELTVRRITD